MSSASESDVSSPRIVVVGSINMDLVARMSRLPRPGETVLGTSFQTIPGGKGANQAVAAARLGANVMMIGCVGKDAFGDTLRRNLQDAGVNTVHVLDSPDVSSGVALIGVDDTGANSIAVVPGANALLTPEVVASREEVIAGARALIVQLETPLDAIASAIRLAHQHGVTTILDPAPAPVNALPDALLSVDIISPNQTEAEVLTGVVVNDWESAKQAARVLQSRGAKDVVLKMGELGALVQLTGGSTEQIPAHKANIVDTTAAGDAFTAALTVALCEGMSLPAATHFACAAGTLACTRFGAQPAMPVRAELEAWMKTDAAVR
ncbi:ribokinase [Schlesneria sp. T3-172]|uniref:ribokinase n=1 Tax=Schlesneria sphaerica TaxID=3373610 RepID=UPI0037C621D8